MPLPFVIGNVIVSIILNYQLPNYLFMLSTSTLPQTSGSGCDSTLLVASKMFLKASSTARCSSSLVAAALGSIFLFFKLFWMFLVSVLMIVLRVSGSSSNPTPMLEPEPLLRIDLQSVVAVVVVVVGGGCSSVLTFLTEVTKSVLVSDLVFAFDGKCLAEDEEELVLEEDDEDENWDLSVVCLSVDEDVVATSKHWSCLKKVV
jgi:hypothetical protein